MVQAPGRRHIGGSAYFVWADPPSTAAPQARGVPGLRRHLEYPTVWERNDGTDIAQALGCTHNTPCFQGQRDRQLWH